MREILFRAKRSDTGEWSYGSLQCFHGFSMFDDVWNCFVPIQYKTIGQFCGVHAKDGRRVFEGDIVETYPSFSHAPGVRYIIIYESASFCHVSVKDYKNGYTGDPIDDNEYGLCMDSCKVIGNIYDNPELLEV